MVINRYISDLHLGHTKVIQFDNRPFKNVDEMERTIVGNWNSVVQPNDTTYILGDFCWGYEEKWVQLLSFLKGNKVLILGNHDVKRLSSRAKKMFVDVQDYKEIADDKRHVVLCHYPIMFYKSSHNKNTYMLCGHVHVTSENDYLEKWTAELRQNESKEPHNYGNIINVGCMMPWIDYTPRTLDEIIAAAPNMH